MLDEVHAPADDDGSSEQSAEAEGAETDHGVGRGALGDTEDDGSEERVQQKRCEMRHG